MIKLKITEEWRAETEEEAKSFMESMAENGKRDGYTVGSNGYTVKQKKKSGEVVEEGYLVKITKIYDSFWG